MSPKTKPHAVVAGAGLAGLTSAIALSRRGVEVTVLERAGTLAPAGAGISLWPNALRALAQLGLEDAVLAAAAPAGATPLTTWDGHEISASVAERLPGRFGAPLVVIHRADLQAILLDALGADHVRTGAAVTGVEEAGEKLLVHRDGGETLRAHLLVGADGVHSAVRAAVVGDAPAAYAGYTAWRGVADGAAPYGERFGRGALLGAAPLPGGRTYWWASVRGDESRPADDHAFLVERFTGWAGAGIVAATDPAAVIRTPLVARRALKRMSAGRVAFAGDAAHPMLPNIGQGGGQAIEDGVVLGLAVAAAPDDIPAALARYDALRARRGRKVAALSAKVARLAHLSNPAAVVLRNALLRATPADANLRRLAPVVGHDVAAAFTDLPAGTPVRRRSRPQRSAQPATAGTETAARGRS